MSKEYPCVYYDNEKCRKDPPEEGYVDWCVMGPCSYETPSNADRIRSMSDEELAEFLESTHSNMAIKLGGEYIVREKEYIEIWLKQPAEEET